MKDTKPGKKRTLPKKKKKSLSTGSLYVPYGTMTWLLPIAGCEVPVPLLHPSPVYELGAFGEISEAQITRDGTLIPGRK